MDETDKKDSFRMITTGGVAEIVEKKSRFIATLKPVKTEEEAVEFIESIKKQYWDARHNCSAFVIGSKGELSRCSDDGEPSGTAGKPMLEVLLGEGIKNVAVVVTRYFGGTLLGTGGLVRAYTEAVRAGLSRCETACCRYGVHLQIDTDYNGGGKIRYLLEQMGYRDIEAIYSDQVSFRLMIPVEEYDQIKKEIIEVTNGKALLKVHEKKYYIDKESL